MCSSGKFLKLCTCSSESIDPNSIWTLYRGRLKHPIVGSFMPPDASLSQNSYGDFHSSISERKFLAMFVFSAEILTDLNSYDVFDFEFSAQDGDILMITFKGENYNFEFSQRDGWTRSEGRAWRTLTEHLCGCVVLDPAP